MDELDGVHRWPPRSRTFWTPWISMKGGLGKIESMLQLVVGDYVRSEEQLLLLARLS